MRRRDARWLLLALVALAFALRVCGLQFQGLWRDEIDSIRFAEAPLRSLLAQFSSPGQNGPLYFLLLKPWLWGVGTGDFGLRFSSALAGTLVVPLAYRLAARLLRGSASGLLVAALAATSPYLVWYSQEGKMYALVVCTALASTVCLLAAMKSGGWRRWLGYAAVTAASFYLHILAALLIPAQVIMFLLLGGWRQRAARIGMGASLAALMLPYLPLLAWQLPLVLHPGSAGYRFVPLPSLLGSLISSYSVGVAPEPAWLLVPSAGLLAAGGLSIGRGALAPAARAAVAWFLVPAVCLFAVTLVRPIYTARYLIFVLPALWAMIAVGASRVGRWSRGLAVVLIAAVLAANAYGLWVQARTPLKADLRAATHYVAEHKSPDDLLLFQIPYTRYSFDYYYARGAPRRSAAPLSYTRTVFLPYVGGGAQPYRRADGPYTNSGLPQEELDREMARLVRGSRVIWLVESEAELWDERGLARAWLDAHYVLTDRAEFVRVVVYRYAVP